MTYSLDFRKSVMFHLANNNNIADTSRLFSISRTTIYEWKARQKKKGNFERSPVKRSFKKIDPKVLIQRVSDNPNTTLREHADYFGTCFQAVSAALRKLKITRKKE
jgi:transposase